VCVARRRSGLEARAGNSTAPCGINPFGGRERERERLRHAEAHRIADAINDQRGVSGMTCLLPVVREWPFDAAGPRPDAPGEAGNGKDDTGFGMRTATAPRGNMHGSASIKSACWGIR
jgi:hypothetical protein